MSSEWTNPLVFQPPISTDYSFEHGFLDVSAAQVPVSSAFICNQMNFPDLRTGSHHLMRTAPSTPLDARSLDDTRPFDNLGLDYERKFLGRAAYGLDAAAQEQLLHILPLRHFLRFGV